MSVSHVPIRCMYLFGQKRSIAASVSYYYPKHYCFWFIHDMVIPNACISADDGFNDFGI